MSSEPGSIELLLKEMKAHSVNENDCRESKSLEQSP